MTASKHQTDTLIVGQGLAGSILAWQLLEKGQNIMLVSDESAPPASRVAAGLFNPVTGKRLVLQSRAAEIIPTARDFYHSMETFFGRHFFHENAMLRIIRSDTEREAFEKRSADPAYGDYLLQQRQAPEELKAPLGVIVQNQTGYLDTNALLDRLKGFFISKVIQRSSGFNHAEMTITDNAIEWRDIRADRVIFCEGYLATRNPWFSWLPFQPAKGEILTLGSNSRLPDAIINGGKWLLPLIDGRYKTGATYDHDLSKIAPSKSGKTELLTGMQRLLSCHIDVEVVEHKAGVRPNTLDKNPFIGMHPEQPNIGIFNGFGSRGSMLIPFYSQTFSAFLTDGSAIPAEADIARVCRG